MSRCTILDEPNIEDGAVVLRVIHRDPAAENTGRVFVCRMMSLDSLTVAMFPEGQAPISAGEYRAEAAEAARAYVAANSARFQELFEELARRKGTP